MQRIIENLGNTTVCLNDIDRAHEQSEYMTYAHTNAFNQFVVKLDGDVVYYRQLTDTGELGVLAENGMKSRVTHDRKVSSAENGAELANVLYRHAERADADILMAMLVQKGKLVAKSDTFAVDQTQLNEPF